MITLDKTKDIILQDSQNTFSVVGVGYDHSILHPDVMMTEVDKSNGLAYNILYHLWICLYCNKCGRISLINLQQHFRKKSHKVNESKFKSIQQIERLTENKNEYLNSVITRVSSLPSASIEDVDYVPYSNGIPCLPIWNGWNCRSCYERKKKLFCYKSKEVFKKHLKEQHNELNNEDLASKLVENKCVIQSKYGKGVTYYPVTLLPGTVSNVPSSWIDSLIESTEREKEQVDGKINDAGVQSYKGKTKFFDIAQFTSIGTSCCDDRLRLSELVSGSTNNSLEKGLELVCCKFMDSINLAIDSSGNLLRNRIVEGGGSGNEEKVYSGSTFTRVSTAVKNYAPVFSSLLKMFVRIEQLLPDLQFTSTPILESLNVYVFDAKLRSLVKLLSDKCNAINTLGDVGIEHVLDVVCIMLHIMDLRLELTAKFNATILHTFVVAKTLKKSNGTAQFVSMSCVAPTCSILQFAMKGSVLLGISNKILLNKSDTYYLNLLEYVRASQTPYAIVCSVLSTARGYAGSDRLPTISYGLKNNGRIDINSFNIDGVFITSEEFVAGSNALILYLKDSMKTLSYGFDKIPDDLLNLLYDDVNCNLDNFWYMKHPGSSRLRILQRLHLKYIVDKLFTKISDERIVAKPTLYEFLKQYDEVVGFILATFHIYSGNCGRATELETIRLKNSFDGGVLESRSVFFSIQYQAIFIIPPHNKRKLKLIPRILTGEVANLFVYFTTIIRPTVEFVICLNRIKDFNPVNLSRCLLKCHDFKYLFLNSEGKALKADDICKLFAKYFLIAFKKPLTIKSYRQLASTLVNSVLRFHEPLAFREVIQKYLSLPHNLFGHSLETLILAYDVNDLNFLALDPIIVASCYNWTLDWVEFCTNGIKISIDAPKGKINQIKSVSKESPSELDNIQSILVSLRNSMSSLEQRIEFGFCQEQPSSSSNNIMSTSTNTSSLSSTAWAYKHDDIDFTLHIMRSALGNMSAYFRSHFQMKYISTCLHSIQEESCNDSYLLIQKTGGGKSLGYISCAVYEKKEQSSKITVVVCPLVAVAMEQKLTVDELGLNCIFYRGNISEVKNNLVDLIFITPELLLTKDFREYLVHLKCMDLISSLWFDEAHLILFYLKFRISLCDASKILQELNVPLWYLSGSLTIGMESVFKKYTGESNLIVLRSSTNRPRIHYMRYDVELNLETENNSLFMNSPDLSKVASHAACIARYLVSRAKVYGMKDFRIILFSSSKKEVAVLYSLLRASCTCLFFHGDLEEMKKKETLNKWVRIPEPVIMLGTSSLAQGMDKKRVDVCFTIGLSRGLVELAQSAGRVGRKLNCFGFHVIFCDSKSTTLSLKQFESEIENNKTLPKRTDLVYENFAKEDLHSVVKYCQHQGCLRQFLYNYLDSEILPPCFTVTGNAYCSYCISKVHSRELVLYSSDNLDPSSQKVFEVLSKMNLGSLWCENGVQELIRCSSTPSQSKTTLPPYTPRRSEATTPSTINCNNSIVSSIVSSSSSCYSISSNTSSSKSRVVSSLSYAGFEVPNRNLSYSSTNTTASNNLKRTNTNIQTYRELIDCCDALGKKCYVCFIFGDENPKHNCLIRRQKFGAKGCYACSSDEHGTTSCPYNLVTKLESSGKYEWVNRSQGMCHRCTLPIFSNHKTSSFCFHNSSNIGSKCRFKDCDILRFVYHALNQDAIVMKMKEHFVELKAIAIPSKVFQEWCLSESCCDGIMNVTLIALHIFKLLKQFQGLKNIT